MAKREGNAKKRSAVVLLSSGLDSTYNLYRAHEEFRVLLALTFDYGQKSAKREREYSARLARNLRIPHQIIDVSWFRSFTQTGLVADTPVPQGTEIAIESLERSQATAKLVWVPNRNGIFLSIAAGFAEGLGAEVVIPGFNQEEATTFPDNSGEFLASLEASWTYSTASGVRTQCYTLSMDKTQIVKSAVSLGMPLHQLWPCYLAESMWCGRCESCLRFRRALEQNNLSYEKIREQGGEA